MDTIKLMAYRAQTALVLLVREKLDRLDDARTLMRQEMGSAADLYPEFEAKTMMVRVHLLAIAAHDAALQHLCVELTETETL